MADEKDAKKYLETRKRQPWDEPLGPPPSVEAKKPSPEAPKKSVYQDEVDRQYGALKKRNEEFDKGTRYLRKD